MKKTQNQNLLFEDGVNLQIWLQKPIKQVTRVNKLWSYGFKKNIPNKSMPT